MLGWLEWWWLWGIYSPQPLKQPLGVAAVDGHTGQSGAPPDTVWCASHVTQLLGFDRWSSDNLAHRTVTVHCPVRLLVPALTLRALSAHCSAFTGFRWSRSLRCSRCTAGTPDSPVNYSGVAFQKPEAEQFRVDLPGATDTVQWHTGQSGALDQGSLRLVLLLSF